MLKAILHLLLIGLLQVNLIESCGRQPVITKPTELPSQTTGEPDTEEASHRQNCTYNETQQAACFRGRCFVYVLTIRVAACDCPEMYGGVHCEYYDPNLGNQEEGLDRMATASIAASAVAVILFIAVLACIFIWHKRYKKRKEKEQKEKEKAEGPNCNTHLPLLTDPESPDSTRKNGSVINFENEHDVGIPLRTTCV